MRAIRDPLLSERHRIVLAEIIMRTNSQTGVAYPGYRGIAEATGYSESTVELTVTQLLAWGYLASTRKAAEPGGRALAHYTVIKPTVEQLQAAIAAHMMAQRGKADPNPTVRNTDPNPTVRNNGSVPNPPPRKKGSVPNPVVRQYLEEKKELEERGPADAGAPPPDLVDRVTTRKLAASSYSRHLDGSQPSLPSEGIGAAAAAMAAALSPDAAYAVRNIKVEKGRLVIGDELRADLRTAACDDAEIDLALPRALERAGGSTDPIKLLPRIHWAISYVLQDKAKAAKWQPPKTKPKGTSRYVST